jgi:hypothetical protein
MVQVVGFDIPQGIAACGNGKGKVGAVGEGKIANEGNPLGNGDAGQVFAAGKGAVTNEGNALGNGNAGQAFAGTEGAAANGGDPLRELMACIGTPGGTSQ